MMLIDVANRHQIDTRRADVEVRGHQKVDVSLLDFGGAVQLVVVIEA
jgi:hypothetical protein